MRDALETMFMLTLMGIVGGWTVGIGFAAMKITDIGIMDTYYSIKYPHLDKQIRDLVGDGDTYTLRWAK